MKTTHPQILILTVALLAPFGSALWTGCGDRPEIYDEQLQLAGPIVVGRHLAYMDKTREQIVLVRPYTRGVRHITVGRRPSFMLPTPDQSRLLVICKGWVARERDEEDENPSLHIVDPDSGDSEVHDIGTPFDEVSVSDDNRYAVAYFSANADPGDTEVFRNPNAVAILDMDSGNLEPKNVRSLGDLPRGVIFSPSTMAPLNPDSTLGEPRTLAVVFAEGYITILDVSHPERSEVTIRLTLPGMTDLILAQQMVWAPESGTAYLRASGTSDVYAFTFLARQPSNAMENDFVVSINTLAAGTVPADVAVFTDGGERKVLLANQQSRDLTVIDAYTSQFVTIPVGDPVDRILVYPEEDPYLAVVFSQGIPGRNIHFLDLVNVEENRGQNLYTLHSAESVLSLELIPHQAAALVIHSHNRTAMSVLDLEDRTLAPFRAHNSLASYAINYNGEALVGFTAGDDMIGIIDLDNLSAPRPVQLSFTPKKVLAMSMPEGEAEDAESHTVVVDHGSPFGLITVIPAPLVAASDNLFVMSGFIMEGLMEVDHD